MKYRTEHDTMGEIQVPAQKLWGAQTQRSLQNFPIGWETIPIKVIHAFAYLKKACALANESFQKLPTNYANAISQACDEILNNQWNEHFPLSVWQTGSGTQTNMNVNEVIANRATQILGKDFTKEKLIHPNDHVNMSQSSNDTFPTAMHIAAVFALEDELLPSLQKLANALEKKQQQFYPIIKIGRTHLQDATPLRLGQEFSGYVAMLKNNQQQIQHTLKELHYLTIGGTAVGTGLNAPKGFGPKVCEILQKLTKKPFLSLQNYFYGLTSHDSLTFASGALKALSANLMKIANDIRWLASGPRCGIGEIQIPANEPGSSIMPGKVNPTQAEALTMVACQVMGNDATIGFAASQGNFELNVFKPLIIYNFLQSCQLLTDAMHSFRSRCVEGIQPNPEKIQHYLQNSLMLVTALNPYIGYEKAAQIAKKAFAENISLKQAATQLGLLSEEEFDNIVKPEKMV